MKTPMKALLIAASVATAHVAVANTLTVPGTADPLLAGGGTDNYGSGPANYDSTPAESAIFAGYVTGGSQITVSATGSTGNTPSISGVGPAGSGGNYTFSAVLTGGADFAALSAAAGAFSAPLNSLIGVFTGPGVAEFVDLGASSTVTVPAGATGFYLGSMDGYQWNNNSGSFTVDVTGANVPDGGTTAGLLGGALVGLGALRRKWSV